MRVENSDFDLVEEPEEPTGRSSWVRRVSTIAQSRDGSTVSTTRPSTPSLFSNGSNVPFLGPTQPTTPRNRLVKRSTSHRVLHSASYSSGSPFSASQTSTFRRPATSHQRSEQLKLQSLQREFESPHRVLETFDENRSAAWMPKTAAGKGKSPPRWEPYFQTWSIRVPSDTSRRSASVPRLPTISSISRHHESVRCVQPPLGLIPALVKGDEIEKYSGSESQLRHITTRFSSPLASSVQKPHPNALGTQSANPQSESATKPRGSFSIGGIMSTPSPPWRSKGGSLRRKKGRGAVAGGRRISSAPQKGISDVVSDDSPSGKSMGLPSRGRGFATTSTDNGRVASSPLPTLHLTRHPPIDIELPRDVSSGPPSPVVDQPTTPSPPQHSETHPPTASSSFHMKPSRASRIPSSRIPSDRESTVFSSDNERGGVFSADGDDTDYRSEYQFDSLRTDATGNSHAGAKSHHVETVFRDTNTPELKRHNLATLQEAFGQTSISGGTMQHDYIAEEDESTRTPVQVHHNERERTASPRRPRPTSSTNIPSSPPTLPTPTRQNEAYPQELDFEDEWSADDGDDEHDDDDLNIDLPGQFPGSDTDHARRVRDVELPERPKSNIFDWSERPLAGKDLQVGSSPRPRSAHVKQNHERGSRSSSRRGPSWLHLRSQSVPLPPENNNYRLNSAAKLNAWMLDGKDVSEHWDGDFDFDEEPEEQTADEAQEEGETHLTSRRSMVMSTDSAGVLVPPSIIEKQASVRGQFGQVREFTLLVHELEVLRRKGSLNGIINGKASHLWKEADEIIKLASKDDDGSDILPPHSSTSASFELDGFDDESIPSRRRRSSSSPQVDGWNDGTPSRPSPAGSRFNTPTGRPRKESIANAKNILSDVPRRRNSLESLLGSEPLPQKLHFDTTSLRDLVIRTGAITRLLKEEVRKAENPGSFPNTPEKRSATPPDPPFSQIFNKPSPSGPSSVKKSPRIVRRRSSSNFVGTPKSTNDNEINGHMKVMTVA